MGWAWASGRRGTVQNQICEVGSYGLRQSELMSCCGRQVALSRKELGTEPWGGSENVVVGMGGGLDF